MTSHTNRLFSFLFSIKGILSIAVILRLMYAIASFALSGGFQAFIKADTPSYVEPAIELLKYGSFTTNNVPSLLRTPGYSIFLLPGLIIGHLEIVTIILQLVLAASISYLVYKISLATFQRENLAKTCALLYAVEPFSVKHASLILSDTLFTFLIVSIIYCLINYYQTQSTKKLIYCALLLSMSTFVRPVNMYLPFVIAAILLPILLLKKKMSHTFSTQMSHRKICTHIFLIVFIPLLFTTVWTTRNYLVAGYPKFSSSFDYNIYCQVSVNITAYKQDISRPEAQEALGCKNLGIDDIEPISLRVEKYTQLGNQGKDIVLENPWTFFKALIVGMAHNLVAPGFDFADAFGFSFGLMPDSGQELRRGDNSIKILEGVNNEFLLMLGYITAVLIVGGYALFAIIALFSKGFVLKTESIFILLIGLYLLAMSSGIAATRMRLPIEPIICIMSGYSLFGFAQRVRYLFRKA